MRKILEIVKKNFKVLMRSKISAAVIVLGPLVLMLLVGSAFNTANIYDIKIATYSDSYSKLSNELVGLLSDQQFKVNKIDNQEICINSVKQAENHVCIVFPKDLNVNAEGEIAFYVDQSRINLIWVIIDAIGEKVSVKSEQISQELTKVLVDNLDQARNVLGEKKNVLRNLTSDSADAEMKLSTIKDDLTSLNLSSNITNMSTIENEIDSLKNETGGDFEALSSLFGTLRRQITQTTEKLELTSNTIKSKTLELGDLQTTEAAIL